MHVDRKIVCFERDVNHRAPATGGWRVFDGEHETVFAVVGEIGVSFVRDVDPDAVTKSDSHRARLAPVSGINARVTNTRTLVLP